MWKSVRSLPANVLDSDTGALTRWHKDLESLVSPLDELSKDGQKSVRSFGLRSEAMEKYQHFFGARDIFRSPQTPIELVRSLPQYLEYRGTLRALRQIVLLITGLNRFKVIERYLPNGEIRLGESQFDSRVRLLSVDTEDFSLQIDFDHYEYETSPEQIFSLRSVLSFEFPENFQFQLKFKVQPIEQEYEFTQLGEQLL